MVKRNDQRALERARAQAAAQAIIAQGRRLRSRRRRPRWRKNR